MSGYESGAFVGIFYLSLVVLFVVNMLFLTTLHQTLKLVPEEKRNMSPGQVWLNLIPIFNLGWMIYTAVAVARSIGRARGISDTPTMGAGLTYSIGGVVAAFVPVLIPVEVVLFAVYWIRVAKEKKLLRLSRFTPDGHAPYPRIPE